MAAILSQYSTVLALICDPITGWTPREHEVAESKMHTYGWVSHSNVVPHNGQISHKIPALLRDNAGYGTERSLFSISKWVSPRPACIAVLAPAL